MTGILVSFLNLIRDLIINHFPSLTVEGGTVSTMLSSLEMVIQFMAQINFIVPLPTILLVISLVYGFKVLKFSIFLVNWVIRRIRGG